ncbi:MAG: hypothetical protein WEE66_06455 [Actinomycetota bacterium]
MRRTLLGVTIALVGTGCTAPPSVDPATVAAPIEMLASPSPFTHVTAGPVTAIVPDGWKAHPPAGGSFRGGFLASPHPTRWNRMDGGVAGMSATWVDATMVGMPSDFYYLAATGPLLSSLTHSSRCSAESRRVFVDRRPTFSGIAPTQGDFVARGAGTCLVGGVSTRWAYFVAAPGYGPVRQLGIAASGLYVVVAVTPENERAPSLLNRLIRHTSFGGSSVDDLVDAAAGAIRV